MKIRVFIADDSVVMRQVVTRMLESDPDLDVVATAPNGAVALEKLGRIDVDLLISDVEMPEMDGLELVAAVHKLHPHLPIIMFSSVTERGAAVTIEALARGATDYETKPQGRGLGAACSDEVSARLIAKVKMLGRRGKRASIRRPETPAAVVPQITRVPARAAEVVAIGVSTGGPNALRQLFADLPGTFPVPIVVVQHMPPMFTKSLAESLDRSSGIRVVEVTEGDVLTPGTALIAPGGYHMALARRGAHVGVKLNRAPLEHSCRPAVDVLFRSVAPAYGNGALAVVLTGMGRDGLDGARHVRAAGGQVLAQDEATSVVWGMPGAVASEGVADAVVALDRMGKEIWSRSRHIRAPLAESRGEILIR